MTAPKSTVKAKPMVTASVPTWISDLRIEWQCPAWVPRQPSGYGSTIYILYVYSGHRREGDVISWAKQLGSRKGLVIEVITIDVVYDAELCDMRSPRSKELWAKYVAKGYFAALLGAPPCETFSAARLNAAEDGGPPPVRSLEEPWGMMLNSLRHQKQVLVSNDLMQAWLLLVLEAYDRGTMVLMEHPAPSTHHPSAPSIWKTAELLALQQLPRVEAHLVLQGLFGAASAKPTTFLACHVSNFQSILKQWHDPDVDSRKWIHLKGRNADGSWKTSQGKAYPSRLNAALMDCIIQQLPGHLSSEETAVDSGFWNHTRTVLHAQEVSGKSMGPDFARI